FGKNPVPPGTRPLEVRVPDQRLGEVEPEGRKLVKLRMEEEEVPYQEIQGTSYCRDFRSGYQFELTDHYDRRQEGTYLLTTVQHSAVQSPDYLSEGEASEAPYYNSFTCIPEAIPFRPPRVTPKPVVQGLQSAVVVGKKGEEIWTDKYGRVRVQFHWDRKGKRDEQSTCWVRVAQPWAGKQWGAIFLPRIGQEVVVAFLEGDPDQPLVVGSVYNAENMPPYELPANQTQSGIKTRSSKGGGASNFNELRFEDKKGSEHIYFHAEKDFLRLVENDDKLAVGHDQTIVIKNNRTETVKEGDETVTIEQGNRTVSIDTGNETLQVKQGDRLVSVDMGNDTHQIKQGNRDVQIDMGNDTLTIKMGNQTTKLNLGKSSTEAMQSIELKVGTNSIKIDQTGITLKGLMIKIEGQMMTQMKGMMTQVNGNAMLQLKGGITMIG
ncbi:MAG: type VI secretion system tip protein VgrG, partial [Nitrospinota bacterium]